MAISAFFYTTDDGKIEICLRPDTVDEGERAQQWLRQFQGKKEEGEAAKLERLLTRLTRIATSADVDELGRIVTEAYWEDTREQDLVPLTNQWRYFREEIRAPWNCAALALVRHIKHLDSPDVDGG